MDWTRGRTVGRGSTATVSIAADNRSGEVFAVKSAELSKSEFLKREQRILSTLVCPQIVAYKGCDISSENGKLLYNLFLEYVPGGTLIDAICVCGGGLEEGRIRSCTRAILLGLEYLHSNGVVHCDIKGQNILISNGGAKIADLGCARRVDEVSNADWGSTTPISGTPAYMAPEVTRGEEQGFPADVWALGCTVLEMATGRGPWADVSDPVSALYRIRHSSDGLEIPRFMSKQTKDFLSKCLKRNPSERWSASELLQHDFVKDHNFLLAENETYNLETPTSVLDQGIWNSIERLQTTWNSTEESCSNSAKDRIRQLSEGNSEMLSWAWDGTWFTVRSNVSKEPDCNLSSTNEVSIGGGVGRISNTEEYNLDIPDDESIITSSSEIIKFDTSNKSSSSSRRERSPLMAYKLENDKLCTNLALRNKKIWLSNSTSMQYPLFFFFFFPLLQPLASSKSHFLCF